MIRQTQFASQKQFLDRRQELRALREAAGTVADRIEATFAGAEHESPIDTAELRAILRAPNAAPVIREFADEHFVADLRVPEENLDLLHQEVLYLISDGCPSTLWAQSPTKSKHRPT